MSSAPEARGAPPHDATPARATPGWRKALPYGGSAVIFALIFWRIPFAKVADSLRHVPVAKFVGVFLPFLALYWIVDSYCLTWVVRRFNAPVRYRDMFVVRTSMYLLSLINTNLGQGGVAYYLHRKVRIPFLEALSSILFIALLEIYQLFLFSTLGVIFYAPASSAQTEIVGVLRIAYVIAWALLFAVMGLFAAARRNEVIREWIVRSRVGALAGAFLEARPLDYAIVLGIKSPSFLGSVVAHYFALRLFGIAIPFVKLVLFLPLVFLAAALPIAVAHLGTSQAAWLLFFSGNAPQAEILAYSLAAHFTFMFCNAAIGLCFLPRASRELTAVEAG